MIHTLFQLQGRVALVTGGSKGIGLAIARGLAECGADVVICSRHQEQLERAAAEIREGLATRVEPVVADMSDRRQVEKLAAQSLARMGRIDILVNNAGTNQPQTLRETTDEVWDRLLELNLTSCMRLTRALVPQMVERKWGRVIYISSIMGLASSPGRGCYSATKAALLRLAQAHALELGPYGITVNCIAPGPVMTDLPMSLLSDEQKERFARRTALGRWGEPREMVGPAILLATEAGAYITGSYILADGGVLCRTFD
jgi:NAD(P)-dependent dehydrogenase (short-subunit alcohol dehydrogenase family)